MKEAIIKTAFLLTLLFLVFAAGFQAAHAQTCTNSGDVPVWSSTTKWTCVPPATVPLPVGSAVNMTVANDTVTGTTVNRLAKLTGAPSKAIISATTDTENAVGVVTAGAGTTGNATIAILGQVTCDFDGATTAGNYVVISSTTAGKCHDGGSAFPNALATYGRVLSTNGASGAFVMELMTPDIGFQNAGNGKSKPGGSTGEFQWNNAGVFAGSALKTSGTAIFVPDTSWTYGWGSGGGAITFSIVSAGVLLTNGEYVGSLRTTNGSPKIYISPNVSSAGGITLANNGNLGFAAGGDATAGQSAGYSLNAAGTIEVNNGNPTSASSEAALRDLLSRHYFTGKTTTGNCLDSAGAAACGAASAGSVVIDAGSTSVVVSTTSVTANSEIFVTFDSSLGTRLGVTCNTTAALPFITARTAATSFTITVTAAPTVNPACYSYSVVN